MFRKLLTACAATSVALTGVTTFAQATARDATPSRVVLDDGTGDVWTVDLRTSHWSEAGEVPGADVTRAVVAHRTHAVAVRMRFVDLTRRGRQSYWAGLTVPGDDFFVDVVSRRGARAGRATLYDEPGGRRVACRRLAHDIDYERDLVRVWVPRACLARPTWVRGLLGNELRLGVRPDRAVYADNPHDDGAYVNQGTRRLYPG